MVCSWPTLLGMLTEGMVWMTCRICWPPAPWVARMEPGERTCGGREGGASHWGGSLTGSGCICVGFFALTIEPIDWTPDGTGVADRPGWLTAVLGAGLTVALADVVAAGSEAERGLLSDRSTGSVWSSAADC